MDARTQAGSASVIPVDSDATLPLVILDWLERIRGRRAVFVAPDEAVLQALARAMPVLAPDHEVLALPAWDNLPYDRARPSRQATGARIATLAALSAFRSPSPGEASPIGACPGEARSAEASPGEASYGQASPGEASSGKAGAGEARVEETRRKEPRPRGVMPGQRASGKRPLTDRPQLVLTSPEALVQLVPPQNRVRERAVPIEVGQDLDPEWLRQTLLAFGYKFDDRVEEPGEAALHGGTIDIHLAGADLPIRLEIEDGRIISMRWFDPVSQRSRTETSRAVLIPTTEAFTVPGEDLPPENTDEAGDDDANPDNTADDAPPGAAPTGDEAAAREPLLPDGPLATLFDYLPDAVWGLTQGVEERCESWLALVHDAWEVARITAVGASPPPPDRLYMSEADIAAAIGRIARTDFAAPTEPGEGSVSLNGIGARVRARRDEGDAVVLCVPNAAEAVRPAIARRLRIDPSEIAALHDWAGALALPAGQVGVLRLPLGSGFRLPGRSVLALQVSTTQRRDADLLTRLAGMLHLGDLVVEPQRGLARLTGLTMEQGTGVPTECLRLAFLGQSALIVPCTEADRVWRYGSGSTIKADRLDAGNWEERVAAVQEQIEDTARALVERMRARQAVSAPVIEPAHAYGRFVRRRPYPLTPDQVRAIRAVQQDLTRGRPMMRLICGDVGYGKTEVALHAAALVAAAGRQVAIVAPTTLLARQHLDVFRRQLGGLGLRVEGLIRSSRLPENQDTLGALRAGEVDIVVGTHGLASARFKDLGLVVIDEEQRFGEAHKRRLRQLQGNVHALIMTGTPLPRSLQGALSGLIEVSVLSTPPAARQPGRSFVTPLSPVLIRAAILREAHRGGQSFFVCPRVEDIPRMHARLRELVPEMRIAVAHGKLRGEELDRVMIAFTRGEADVLLATSIIEAGLDLPNANTMLIWRADRFGLAQLHQLRGRVGRGRERATTYLLTDPDRPPSTAGRKRLETLATLDSLGAGFAISLADLDQRGAGDLLGDEQSGHIRLFGTELYRDILERALARARGENVPERWRPDIVLDVPAYIPADFVPEPDERLGIYRHLAGLQAAGEVDEAEDDLVDRFGEAPPELLALLDLARLRIACTALGIARVQAGPSAVALTLRDEAAGARRFKDARRAEDRLLLPIKEPSGTARLNRLLERLVEASGG